MNAVTIPSIEPFKYRALEDMGGFGSTFAMGRPRLGLSIQDTDDGKGVKVLDVDEESNAAKAGIKEDDVILSIDEMEIHGTDDVVKATRTQKDKYNYSFKVSRNGKTETIQVNVPRKLKTADL
jgi:serine protease Do